MNYKLSIAVFSATLFTRIISFSQTLPPASATEDWSTKPPVVVPAESAELPPSDAVVLYSGKGDLDQWEHLDGSAVKWEINAEGMMIVPKTTDIQTKQKFGSAQVHVEWKTPDPKEDQGMNRGNSGVFLMGLYELQIYESYNYETRIYYNGQAGSVYKQHIPLVNAARKPQAWQSFDIIFNAPVFNADKTLKTPAYMTVLHNNVLILNHVELKGPMVYQGFPKYEYHEAKMPLRLQEHGSRVSFRNIWIREL
ncbi:3-keto-disaccharide hydrolase [Dyadobacter fanqingshengii]|uniref:DUF1080 domain-containing protein n=1 Tax=Dyadobacter fanqingshengii TaxID=2906443 RepID=A0A9X1P838_9BACT|nr:DUF1080 domain-containing protein [Dyadobacter fanqingshengii]MCF0040539.1 DUF1080 domain-containing protein [Dyadobacter fanqingshengii]USJ37721.1 DUF1080 domain-containing protein [Dyadobacter fanqingshengii]